MARVPAGRAATTSSTSPNRKIYSSTTLTDYISGECQHSREPKCTNDTGRVVCTRLEMLSPTHKWFMVPRYGWENNTGKMNKSVQKFSALVSILYFALYSFTTIGCGRQVGFMTRSLVLKKLYFLHLDCWFTSLNLRGGDVRHIRRLHVRPVHEVSSCVDRTTAAVLLSFSSRGSSVKTNRLFVCRRNRQLPSGLHHVRLFLRKTFSRNGSLGARSNPNPRF